MWLTVPFVALAYGLRGDRERLAVWRTRVAEVSDITEVARPALAPITVFVDARLAVHLRDLDQAAELAERARRLPASSVYRTLARAAGNDWATATLLGAAGRLRGDAGALARSAELWRRMGARFEHEVTVELLAGPELP